jgi:hypothetical protein
MLLSTIMHSTKETRQAMREANQMPQRSIVDIDPEDPSQLLDDADQYSVIDVDLDAQPQAEADAELDAAVADSEGEGGAYTDDDGDDGEQDIATRDPAQTTADEYAASADDTGVLYGVVVPRAADTDLDLAPDQESFADSELGEHAFETLEKKMAEGGPAAETESEFVDESDPGFGPNKTSTRDRPVADKGSGGPGGL